MKPIYGLSNGFTAMVELDTGVYQLADWSWLEFSVDGYGPKITEDVLRQHIASAAERAIKEASQGGSEIEYLGRQTQVVGTTLDGCLVFCPLGQHRRISPMAGGAAVSARTPAEWHVESNAFLCGAKGVIHVGANEGQECRIYGAMELPAILIEPLNGTFQELEYQAAQQPNQRALQYLLTDVDGKEYDFGIANNGGQSSSIFEFGEHARLWPDVYYVSSVKLKSTTFKTMIEKEGIDLSSYDALVMDVQGAELLVLQGADDLLDHFRWIRCEAADFEVYKGCCRIGNLDEYLGARGFSRVKTIRADGLPDVGYAYEALYERVEQCDGPDDRFDLWGYKCNEIMEVD